MTAADYRREAETKRAEAAALEKVICDAYSEGHGFRYISSFPVIRAAVRAGLAPQYVEARKLRAECDALDDIACALESP